MWKREKYSNKSSGCCMSSLFHMQKRPIGGARKPEHVPVVTTDSPSATPSASSIERWQVDSAGAAAQLPPHTLPGILMIIGMINTFSELFGKTSSGGRGAVVEFVCKLTVDGEQFQQSFPSDFPQISTSQLLQQNRRVEQRLLVFRVEFERLI